MRQSEINTKENKVKSNLFVTYFSIFSLSSPRSLFRRLLSAIVITTEIINCSSGNGKQAKGRSELKLLSGL
jgi:hypothetical protein